MSGEQEIRALMQTSLESLRQMMDVNTIIGKMMETKDGAAIIPVSRVSCGFVAGGGEYGREGSEGLPFAGGSGAGVSLKPVGFLVVNGKDVRLVSADGGNCVEKAIDSIPIALDYLQKLVEHFSGSECDSGDICNCESKDKQKGENPFWD